MKQTRYCTSLHVRNALSGNRYSTVVYHFHLLVEEVDNSEAKVSSLVSGVLYKDVVQMDVERAAAHLSTFKPSLSSTHISHRANFGGATDQPVCDSRWLPMPAVLTAPSHLMTIILVNLRLKKAMGLENFALQLFTERTRKKRYSKAPFSTCSTYQLVRHWCGYDRHSAGS